MSVIAKMTRPVMRRIPPFLFSLLRNEGMLIIFNIPESRELIAGIISLKAKNPIAESENQTPK